MSEEQNEQLEGEGKPSDEELDQWALERVMQKPDVFRTYARSLGLVDAKELSESTPNPTAQSNGTIGNTRMPKPANWDMMDEEERMEYVINNVDEAIQSQIAPIVGSRVEQAILSGLNEDETTEAKKIIAKVGPDGLAGMNESGVELLRNAARGVVASKVALQTPVPKGQGLDTELSVADLAAREAKRYSSLTGTDKAEKLAAKLEQLMAKGGESDG